MALANERGSLTVVLIGNPNTGKSTLFAALSGVQQRVGNYPGVTVEKKLGQMAHAGRRWALVDLPGTYSLAPRSPDEMVAVDVLLGRQRDVPAPDVVLSVVDANNLERNLYLISQVFALGRPIVIALTMVDVARAHGLEIDVELLRRHLGVPVVSVQAHRRLGLDALKAALVEATDRPVRVPESPFPEPFRQEVARLESTLAVVRHREGVGRATLPRYLVERLLLDSGSYLEGDVLDGDNPDLRGAAGWPGAAGPGGPPGAGR